MMRTASSNGRFAISWRFAEFDEGLPCVLPLSVVDGTFGISGFDKRTGHGIERPDERGVGAAQLAAQIADGCAAVARNGPARIEQRHGGGEEQQRGASVKTAACRIG